MHRITTAPVASLHVAPQLGPEGRLDVLDIQQEMLDHVMRRAVHGGLANITPARSDARALPYEDKTFDAVYAVTALGEIPESERVLREAARVLAPGGRLVIGEFFDRHWISFVVAMGEVPCTTRQNPSSSVHVIANIHTPTADRARCHDHDCCRNRHSPCQPCADRRSRGRAEAAETALGWILVV
ncbi:class I SAM-dependent methyltransferase [Streptomyces sp. NPDC014724]|uniref:class I SAM-dependent methyltransferase n=1 Tax=unclassified Streptomyces TaxID=2593676 RepID=UPI0036FDD8E8